MRHMTTYDDAAVNRLVGSVTLVTDPDVPTLSCIVEATLSDGTTVVEDLRMTARDYAYGWDETSALIRRIGAETGVADAAYARLEAFCSGLPGGSIGAVLDAFAMLGMSRAAAGQDDPIAKPFCPPMPD